MASRNKVSGAKHLELRVIYPCVLGWVSFGCNLSLWTGCFLVMGVYWHRSWSISFKKKKQNPLPIQWIFRRCQTFFSTILSPESKRQASLLQRESVTFLLFPSFPFLTIPNISRQFLGWCVLIHILIYGRHWKDDRTNHPIFQSWGTEMRQRATLVALQPNSVCPVSSHKYWCSPWGSLSAKGEVS